MQLYRIAMQKLLERQDLTRDEAEGVLTAMMEGALTPVQIASFLTALTMKGETGEELTGLAAAMRGKVTRVDAGPDVIDTCGTGGSALPKTNVSTLAAFILAAGGVRVAKHGNRSSLGRCGSMDLLEQLGVPIDLGPDQVERLIDGEGIGFMFAPRFHPAMAHVAPVRREVGFRTVFNFLGPLTNPAGARRQVLGVSDRRRAPLMAEALRQLGSERVLVVHGEDGLDELTLTGESFTWELRGGEIRASRLAPESAGCARAPFDQLTGGDPARNGELFLAILDGIERGPLRDLTLLNAAAGFWVAEKVADLATGFRLAADLLDAGEARLRFDRYRDTARRLAGRHP